MILQAAFLAESATLEPDGRWSISSITDAFELPPAHKPHIRCLLWIRMLLTPEEVERGSTVAFEWLDEEGTLIFRHEGLDATLGRPWAGGARYSVIHATLLLPVTEVGVHTLGIYFEGRPAHGMPVLIYPNLSELPADRRSDD